jgi:hypothetical protein
MGTNTEARKVALMSDGPIRAYNPDRDILCITDHKAFQNFTIHECGNNGPEWTTKIRHLALGFSLSDTSLYPLLALARLSSLETLSIVFPGPFGTFRFDAIVKSPEDKGTPLRRLTEEELSALTIKADYIYNTWAGDFPVRWTKNGLDYMMGQEAYLDKECCPGRRSLPTPLWDYSAKRLGIRYGARCFQPSPAWE